MTYNSAKAISDYVKPLYKNKYINNTISFAGMMKRVLPLPDDEENVLIQRSVIIWMRP